MRKKKFLLIFQLVVIILAGVISKDSFYFVVVAAIGVVFNLMVSLNIPQGFLAGMVYALTNGVLSWQTGAYASGIFMFVLQAPMAAYSYLSWKKKKEKTDQIMRCMTRKGTGLLTVSMLAGWFVMFFLLPASDGGRGIGIALDVALYVFSVAACLQLAFCYKSAYLVTLLSGLGGTLLWGWKMLEKGTGLSLAAFYLIVLINSVIAVQMQYFSREKECAL
mgnify:CR=1 FL=1